MPKKPSNELPRTAGELRRLIASNKCDWIVDPRLRDNDPLPKYPRGGKPEVAPQPNTILAKGLAEYLRNEPPPTNPFLRERWIALKLLKEHKAGFPGGSPADLVTTLRPRRNKATRSKKGKKS